MPPAQIKKRSWRRTVLGTIIGLIAICAAVLYLASGTMNGPRRGPEGQTKQTFMIISTMYESYYQDYSSSPPPAENYRLVQAFSGDNPHHFAYLTSDHHGILNLNREFVDGSGTPLRFDFKGKNDLVIVSAGPDKIFGTPDDITNQ